MFSLQRAWGLEDRPLAAPAISVNHRHQNLASRFQTHYPIYQCRTGMFRTDIWTKRLTFQVRNTSEYPSFSIDQTSGQKSVARKMWRKKLWVLKLPSGPMWPTCYCRTGTVRTVRSCIQWIELTTPLRKMKQLNLSCSKHNCIFCDVICIVLLFLSSLPHVHDPSRAKLKVKRSLRFLPVVTCFYFNIPPASNPHPLLSSPTRFPSLPRRQGFCILINKDDKSFCARGLNSSIMNSKSFPPTPLLSLLPYRLITL